MLAEGKSGAKRSGHPHTHTWFPDAVFVRKDDGTLSVVPLDPPAGSVAFDGRLLLTTHIPSAGEDAAFEYRYSTPGTYGAADVDPTNGIVAYGYTQAAVLVEVLKGLDTLDRASLMEAMHNMDISGVGMLIDGVKAKTGPGDPFISEYLQMAQYDGAAAHFNNVGELLDFEGKTAEYTPEAMINS